MLDHAVAVWEDFDTTEYTYDRESDVLSIGSLGIKPAWWLQTLTEVQIDKEYEQLIKEEEQAYDIYQYIKRRVGA